ncbi:MAG: VWA domain-containing protein [Acidobacteria bacterium]|nr:VWA domain-containing protein [Acidobacteriota bacterium]
MLTLAFGVNFHAAAQSGRRSQPAPTPTPGQKQETTPPLNQPSQKPEVPDDSDTIKIDTSLVSIPVTALDRGGRYIPFLKKEDFRVYEDGVEQEVADFTSVTMPLHVVLLLDVSRSTAFKHEDIQAAAIAFVEQLRGDDQIMVVSFDDRVYVDSEFTSDRARLRRAIYGTRIGGGTSLYEAVDLVVSERLKRIEGRKAIVLFTDGVDTTSKGVRARDTIAEVEESDVVVFPIQYNTEDQMPGGYGGRRNPGGLPPIINIPPSGGGRRRWPFMPLMPWPQWGNAQFPGGQWPQRGPNHGQYVDAGEYLRQLADRSGGRLYRAETLGNVHSAFTSIAEELRYQYALSYYPSNTAQDGTYRRVRVQAKLPNVVIRAREGYRAKGTPDGKDSGKDRPILRPRQLAGTGQ